MVGAAIGFTTPLAARFHVPEPVWVGIAFLVLQVVAYRRWGRGLSVPALGPLRRVLGPTWTAAGWAAYSVVTTYGAMAVLDVAFR